MKESKDRGLCYHCDEKNSVRHRCKTLCLFLLDGNMIDEENNEQETEFVDVDAGDQKTMEMEDQSEISLHAI